MKLMSEEISMLTSLRNLAGMSSGPVALLGWKKYKDLKKIIQRKCRQAYDNHINSMFGEDEATPNYKKVLVFLKQFVFSPS
jgi:hypothetical protein